MSPERWSGIGPGPAGLGLGAIGEGSVAVVPIVAVDAAGEREVEDRVAVEEPLEIRLEGRPVAVTMRTPGHDLDLVAGFLLTEGVIDGADDILAMAHVDDPADPRGNTIDVRLSPGVPAARRESAVRELFASSSCGICGKASLDRVLLKAPPLSAARSQAARAVSAAVLHALPQRLRQEQAAFDATGGLHAAALFSAAGELEALREDVGRHNAVDKVLGWRLRQDRVPVHDRVLLISGRASFEIVQKALLAGVPALVAVGAPSSLAIDLARRSGMLLVGFLRDGRFNRYSG